jgi:hypothetical protein
MPNLVYKIITHDNLLEFLIEEQTLFLHFFTAK